MISEIDAPHLSKEFVKSCFSNKETPSIGATNKEEPPPDINTTNKSSFLSVLINFITSIVAFNPASSGTG